jgi:hypothetical protein
MRQSPLKLVMHSLRRDAQVPWGALASHAVLVPLFFSLKYGLKIADDLSGFQIPGYN